MTGAPFDRLRLSALRYAVNDEAEQYVAVMRVFTEGTAGLLSDLNARGVVERLSADHGLELEVDGVRYGAQDPMSSRELSREVTAQVHEVLPGRVDTVLRLIR